MSFEDKPSAEHLDNSSTTSESHVKTEEDVLVTWRTYIGVFAFCLTQVYQVWSLFAAAFCATAMATTLGRVDLVHWIPITTSLGQAILAPLFSNCSDTFGNRKLWIGIPITISVLGGIVTGTASTMAACLAGQGLTSIGLGTTALCYSAPSEMTPRRWRPLVQALLNIGAAVGAIIGSITAGQVLTIDPSNGWRTAYYVQIALGVVSTAGFWLAYNPVKQLRKNSGGWKESAHTIDVVGISLLALGLGLLILGISMGGNPDPWNSAKPIAFMVVGASLLLAFAAWERHRKDGILPVALFRDRNFTLSIVAIFIEGVILFGFVVFYPVQTADQWEKNQLNISLRVCCYWGMSFVLALPLGLITSRYGNFKIPLLIGFAFYTAGIVGMSTATNFTTQLPILYAALLGIGFCPILILLVSIAQLSTPPELIGTISAVLVSTRAVGASITPAFLGAILTAKITANVPVAVASAIVPLGLPLTSVKPFIGALLSGDTAAVMTVPGVTKAIVGAAVEALEGALSDSFKWIWYALIPFGVVGFILVLFIDTNELKARMTIHIDAPMEALEFQAQEKV